MAKFGRAALLYVCLLMALLLANIGLLSSQGEADATAIDPEDPAISATLMALIVPTFTATATPAPEETETPTPENTPTAEPSTEPTETATPTPTPTAPPTATRTPAPTRTPTRPPPAPAAAACRTIAGQSYEGLNVLGARTDRPAAQHADLNLGLRGWVAVKEALSPINIGGPTDGRAPQLPWLFAPHRHPTLSAAYQVYNWDFGAGRRTTPVNRPSVTLIGLATNPGEVIHLPGAGYEIGNGYNALVLYATPSRITLKYTREDNVAVGYTIHLEQVCVEPRLIALYDSLNSRGRALLPALRNGQALGSATGAQIIVGIQDAGTWMDPRSRKDWWQ